MALCIVLNPKAVFLAELDLSVVIRVKDINDEIFPASPGLSTHTATVCCVNLWQITGSEPEAGFNINVCRT